MMNWIDDVRKLIKFRQETTYGEVQNDYALCEDARDAAYRLEEKLDRPGTELELVREGILREVANKLLWPLGSKDATHAVDDYRRGRWDAYQIVKRMLPPDPPELGCAQSDQMR